MRKILEHRGHREPQKTQRNNAFQGNHALSLCEKGGFNTQSVNGISPPQQLSFLCALCGSSVPSVFLSFPKLGGRG